MGTIVLVDGQKSHRHYLGVLLRSFGHEVLEASQAVEVLEIARNRHPALIVTDVLLPAMDGYEFVSQLNSERTKTAIPVIFRVASCYETEAKAAADELGVKHLLTKTASPQTIISQVNAALGIESTKESAAKIAGFEQHRLSAPRDSIDPDAVVYVVDDDPISQKWVSALLARSGLKVCKYSSAEEYLDRLPATSANPNCLLLDLNLRGMSGIALLEAIRARRVHLPVIVLTGAGYGSAVHDAVRLGVFGFLEKSTASRRLMTTIFCALQEDTLHKRRRSEFEAILVRIAALTAREWDLIDLLIDGRSNKQIASELEISPNTVKNHRSHLMQKTGAINLGDLVRMTMIARGGDALPN